MIWNNTMKIFGHLLGMWLIRVLAQALLYIVKQYAAPAPGLTSSTHDVNKPSLQRFAEHKQTAQMRCLYCCGSPHDTTETFKVLLRPTPIEHMHIIAYMPIFVCFDCLSYFNQSINQVFSVIGPMALFGLIVFLFFTCTIGNFRSVVLYIY